MPSAFRVLYEGQRVRGVVNADPERHHAQVLVDAVEPQRYQIPGRAAGSRAARPARSRWPRRTGVTPRTCSTLSPTPAPPR